MTIKTTEGVASAPLENPPAPARPYRGLVYFPEEKPWDPWRPVKVIVVGAGIAGIAASVLISKKVRNSTVEVYERRNKVGGTWAGNTYPGIRCDVPSHSYQLSFEPNPDWSEYYPKGAEIQQYYERLVAKHGLTDHLHLQHEIVSATWLPSVNQWEVSIKDLRTGTALTQHADFFVSAQGRIDVPKLPAIPGLLDTFKGDVIHTARWPGPEYSVAGKRVAVIGNGASGIQLLPNILPHVAHLDHYVRSKIWVYVSFVKDLWTATADAPGGHVYTDEEKARFRDDPQAHLEYRRSFDKNFHGFVQGADVLGSPENEEVRRRVTATMRERLGGDDEWLKRVLPDFAPGCKRPTPAPGYLEGLRDPKTEYVETKIVSADETGLVTADGTHRPVDVVIAATGFKITYTPVYPVIGNDGVDLRDRWGPDGDIGFPETYLGVMAPGFPNYFNIQGPQGNARGGTVPVQCEITATYVAQVIRKIQSQSYAALWPREDSTREFNDIVNGFFGHRVSADKCNTWFKTGPGASRPLLAWPGSFHHRADILRNPRWEDFEFVRRGREARHNRFEYFGDGTTKRERVGDERDLTNYLRAVGDIDLETLHEGWNL